MKIVLKNRARQLLTVSYRDADSGKIVGERLPYNGRSKEIDDADLTAATKNMVTGGHLQVINVK